MNIADIIYRFIPVKWFKKLSAYYYKKNKKYNKALSEDEFRSLLTDRLHICRGDTVAIHSAVDKLNINFEVYRILEILVETVGEEGTLLFPSYHYVGKTEDYLKSADALFDVQNSPTLLGLLNEMARRYPTAIRSCHPTASVCAIGKHASTLTATHHLDHYPCGKESPWYKMMKYNGKIIGLGEKVVSLTFIHCIDDTMGPDFPIKCTSEEMIASPVIFADGTRSEIRTHYPLRHVLKKNITDYFNQNISKNACFSFKYRGMNFFKCDTNLLYNEMTKLAKSGNTIYKQ